MTNLASFVHNGITVELDMVFCQMFEIRITIKINKSKQALTFINSSGNGLSISSSHPLDMNFLLMLG